MRFTPVGRFHISFCALALILALASCATGPAPPAPGTPAWYWQAAEETYAAGDLAKASEHLESLAKPGSEYADRAMPWRMVITGGTASGYAKVADGYDYGAKANRTSASMFRQYMNEFRNRSDKQTLQFAEIFLGFRKVGGEGDIPIVFGYPSGSALPVSEITKAGQGIVLSESELATAERRSIEREVLMTACLAVGAEDDTAKAQGIFAGENVTIPRDAFLLAMTSKLHALSDVYAAKKLNRPDRVKQLAEIALEAAQSLPESDESKDLIKKIERDLKAAEKRL